MSQIHAADENVEIVKAISPDKKTQNESEKEVDQVALESQDQESPPAVLVPHVPPHPPPPQLPPSGLISFSLFELLDSSIAEFIRLYISVGATRNVGQPFVSAPSQHLAYHGPPPPPPPHLAHLHRFPQHPQHPQHPPQLGLPPHYPLPSAQPTSAIKKPPVMKQQPHPNEIPDEKAVASSNNELWSAPATDTPKIVSLDVKCEKKGMKVFLQFDKPFHGIVFSKGHYNNMNCVYLPAGMGHSSATFEIGMA